MKRIATVLAISFAFLSTASFAETSDDQLQPRFKRSEMMSFEGSSHQGASAYSFLTEYSPN